MNCNLTTAKSLAADRFSNHRGLHMPKFSIIFALFSILLVSHRVDAEELFQRAAAVFEQRCIRCHSSQDRRGGLSLVTREAALTGGDSGQAIEPGKPERSLLMQMITGQEPEMPRDSNRLSEVEVTAIHQWIAAGAHWPNERTLNAQAMASTDWWSLQPLRRPELPSLESSGQDSSGSTIENPIDRFILAELHQRGLTQSPESNRLTLIRRVTFDLIGLPPTIEEVEAFCSDPDERAYQRLVDRLISSPGYGERWARHWLDVVHYGETHGYDKDQPRPNAWPYRDYVIRAFNADKPYSQFVQEQIAGDVLLPDSLDGITATGFIAAGPWDLIGHAEVPESKTDGKVARHLDRDDMVSNTINTFQSITVHCAQCHDHKFDPVSQKEYYALQAIFAALDRADRVFDTDPLVAQRRRELLSQKQSVPAEDEVTLQAIDQRLAELPAPLVVYCGTIHSGSGNFAGTGASGGKPRAISMLARGDVTKPLEQVSPGALAYFPALSKMIDLPMDACDAQRRAALAGWLTDHRNPLTWRSIVNRVWLYHFGRGIVDSPNDFGRMGLEPSHPELLDWLATWFRDDAQGSLKQLHKLIVTSQTYRQSAIPVREIWQKANEIDSSNSLLWRQNRRRLEAEAVRDSILAVAGILDLSMGGPSFQDFVISHPEHSPHYEYQLANLEDHKLHRRSIYRFIVRSQQQPWMATLDCADPSLLVDKRNQTITPLQALGQLNNQLVLVASRHFADRLKAMTTDPCQQTRTAIRIALQRNATGQEIDELTHYSLQNGLENMCRIVLNLNEFVFVD